MTKLKITEIQLTSFITTIPLKESLTVLGGEISDITFTDADPALCRRDHTAQIGCTTSMMTPCCGGPRR